MAFQANHNIINSINFSSHNRIIKNHLLMFSNIAATKKSSIFSETYISTSMQNLIVSSWVCFESSINGLFDFLVDEKQSDKSKYKQFYKIKRYLDKIGFEDESERTKLYSTLQTKLQSNHLSINCIYPAVN